jgi:GAF domain-containing protein/two-component sensor histidine kinase
MSAMDQTSHRLTDLSRRYLTGHPFDSSVELDQVLALIPRLSARALHARTAVLRLVDEETGLHDRAYRFDSAEPETPPAAEASLAELTRRETIPILIPDLREDTRLAAQAPARPLSALSVPLLQHEALIGTICVFDKIPATPGKSAVFEEQDVNLLVTLGTEAGIAIENARLFAAASQRADELTALREVGQAIAGRLELPDVLEAVAAGAMRLLGSQHSQILLWDEGNQCLRYGSAAGTEAERVKRQSFAGSGGVNAAVALRREPLMLDDYQRSPYALLDFPDIVATITTPVLFGDRLLGVLSSHTTQPGKRFSPRDLRMLQMLATQAAIAIENARLYQEARERSARFRALSELSRKITASLDLQQVFDYAVQAAVNLLDLAVARLWVWQEATGLLHVRASAGDPDLLLPPRESCAPGDGVIGTAFRTQEVLTLADPEHDPRYMEQAWAQRMGVRQVASVPVRLGERAVGVLSVARRSGRAFLADDIELLSSFAQHAAIAIENARLFREKERLAVEELLRLRKLSILSEIGSVMQGTMQVDALLRVVLTGVTYGGGLGFNRAILLLVDESRQILRGRMGVGPISGDEAATIWGALMATPRALAEVIAERAALSEEREDSAFDRLARSLSIPLRGTESVLARVALEARSVRITDARRDPRVHPRWEGRLDVDEFACAPLMAKGKVVGVLVVDNKFNNRPIGDEDLEFLSAFATQAGLAVENARVYTRLEEANREIQRTQHRLLQQERLAALGEMAAHVVHEIRNPLVAIGGFARRLSNRLAGREPEGQYAQIIAREVERLERIVHDVRGLSRETHLTLTNTDLHTLLQDCLVLFGERIALQRVSVRMELAERLPILRLDAVQMKQAILNLVANALEAMPTGGTLSLATQVAGGENSPMLEALHHAPVASGEAAGTQEVTGPSAEGTTAPPGAAGWATLSVGDTGGGIPNEIVDEVFNPFFTTKEIGTGLGLTLVRRVARAHGGRVNVDNRPGEGVTFCLWLPLSAPEGLAETD